MLHAREIAGQARNDRYTTRWKIAGQARNDDVLHARTSMLDRNDKTTLHTNFTIMTTISANTLKNDLIGVIDGLEHSNEPAIVTEKDKSVIVLSQELWASIEETLYLSSIPGMQQSIIDGMNEPIENGVPAMETLLNV
jgi:PHD/YefM family antitoxin component YafN of YafNO toxin-antitoxin module